MTQDKPAEVLRQLAEFEIGSFTTFVYESLKNSADLIDRLEAENAKLQSRLDEVEKHELELKRQLGAAMRRLDQSKDDAYKELERRSSATEFRLNGALALLRDVATSGVEFEDERVSYVTVQIDADTMKQIREFPVERRAHIDGCCDNCGGNLADHRKPGWICNSFV